jgi:crotonobetainyl-CoA:carnitine CoA-transferase CaiB-like acyl-CoA transferase
MTANPTPLPLDGIRVLDLGMFWAGPFAGKLLADAGAEVIKFESPSHPDNLRILARGVYPGGEAGERPWNRSGMINERNRGKRGIALELGTEQGREIFRELVAISDVVIHNFSTRVLAKWELDYPQLREINSQIILCSIYSQGAEGPESGFVSFGGTLEQIGGITNLTGYPNELPGGFTIQLPDPLGGTIAAGLIIAALRQRRLTGEGLLIDLSQRENVTAILGEQVVGHQFNSRPPERQGNRDQLMAPQGCYPCEGEDAWVTIAVADDGEWSRLCDAIGQPELREDDRFATVLARRDHHDALDELLSSWSQARDKHEAMRELQAHGVRAGAVQDSRDLYADPQLRARGFWERVEDPDAGSHEYPGPPAHLARTSLGTGRATPTLGQDNDYVLRELLGKSDDEVAALRTSGIVGDEPTEAAQRGRL